MIMRKYFVFIYILFISCSETNITDKLLDKKYQEVLDLSTSLVDKEPIKAILITDSILSLKVVLNDATLCKIYQIKQQAHLHELNADSVMLFGDSLRKYAQIIGDSAVIAKSLIVLPDTYIDYSKRKSMNPYVPMALRYFNKPEFQKEYATVLKLKVFQLENEGDYQASLDLLLKAYDIFIKLGEKKEEAKIVQMIANVYGDLNNPVLALKYYKIFEKSAKQLKDSVLIASSYTNYGVYYRKINKDSAIYFYNKALAIHYNMPISLSRVQTEYNLANLHFDKGEYNVARAIYNSLLKTCIERNYREGLVMTYNGLSTIFYAQKNINVAIDYMKKSISLADSLKMTTISLRLRPGLVGVYYGNKDYKSAADELLKMNHLSDSILSSQKQIALIELEKKYQAEVKEKENQYLQVQLKFRQSVIIILVVALIIFVILYRQRNILYKEREISYNAIMQKYKDEKESRDRLTRLDQEQMSLNLTKNELTLYDKIVSYYTIHKPYLNPKFRVDDLADAIDSNQKEIAQTLKMHMNQNFSAFTNKFRVEAARNLFEDKAHYHLKMEVIAEKSGFGTIQSFYNAFETFTGVKPGFYRSQIQTEHTLD